MQEQIQSEIKQIFNVKNITSISSYLNSFVDLRISRIKSNEFETVVEAAKLDGQMELIKQIIDNITQID